MKVHWRFSENSVDVYDHFTGNSVKCINCGNFEHEHQFGKCKHGLKCQIPKCKENGLCPKGNCVRIRK